MKTNILNALKVSALAIVLSFGLSYVYAWTAPAGIPPAGNVAAPINTSTDAQAKAGALTVGSLSAGSGNIGTTGFLSGVLLTSSITFTDGKVQTTATNGGSHGKMRFTTTENTTLAGGVYKGTFTVPAGVTKVWVSMVAGGGGGGGGTSTSNAGGATGAEGGGAGGGAAIMAQEITVVPLSTHSIIVGAGGTAGAGGTYGATGSNGGIGGYSRFGLLLHAAPGNFGSTAGANGVYVGGAGMGGSGITNPSTGLAVAGGSRGAAGSHGISFSGGGGLTSTGGIAGGSMFGPGGGIISGGFGSGGVGGGIGSPGAAGTPGFVLVEW